MIKAGRFSHGLSFFVLCASQHMCWDASSRCAADSSCIISALRVRCWYLVAFFHTPGGVVVADRQGSGGPVVLSWLTCLPLHGGGSCREPHTLWLCEKALITTMGISLTYMTHWWDMNRPNRSSWAGMRQEKILYMFLNSSVLSLQHPSQPFF